MVVKRQRFTKATVKITFINVMKTKISASVCIAQTMHCQ